MNVVRLSDWSWPGVAIGGQDAAHMARVLRWAANLLGDEPSTAAASACQTELRLMANELLACVVDQKQWLDGAVDCATYDFAGRKPGPWPRQGEAA